MAWCKGAFSFSLERNNALQCEEGWETGYLEVSKGVCESSDSINHGCYECEYSNQYFDNYIILL